MAQCDWCDGAGCDECNNTGIQQEEKGDQAGWDCASCGGAGCDDCKPIPIPELTIETKIENLIYEGEDFYRTEARRPLALEKFEEVVKLISEYTSEKDGPCDKDVLVKNMFIASKYVAWIYVEFRKDFREIERVIRSFSEQTDGVSKDEVFQSIETIMYKSRGDDSGWEFEQRVLGVLRDVLRSSQDDSRLLFKVLLLNVKRLLEILRSDDRQFQSLVVQSNQTIEEMHEMCKKDGRDWREKKNSELLDVYAMKTLLGTIISSKDPKILGHIRPPNLRNLIPNTEPLLAGVCDPKSLSIVKECWGKMRANDDRWHKAKWDFFDAFENYSQAGCAEDALRCVKYIYVSDMLAEAQTAAKISQRKAKELANGGPLPKEREDPSEKETTRLAQNEMDAKLKEFQKKPGVVPILGLKFSFECEDVKKFMESLVELRKSGDAFLMSILDVITRDFHKKAIRNLVAPYSRAKFAFISEQLQISEARVEQLLVQLILDDELIARLDQVEGLVDLRQRSSGSVKKYKAIESWSNVLNDLCNNFQQPGGGGQGRDYGMMGRGGMMGMGYPMDDDFGMY